MHRSWWCSHTLDILQVQWWSEHFAPTSICPFNRGIALHIPLSQLVQLLTRMNRVEFGLRHFTAFDPGPSLEIYT